MMSFDEKKKRRMENVLKILKVAPTPCRQVMTSQLENLIVTGIVFILLCIFFQLISTKKDLPLRIFTPC
jgi:hypothetical protein